MTSKCKICGREFESNLSLAQHLRDKHGIREQQEVFGSDNPQEAKSNLKTDKHTQKKREPRQRRRYGRGRGRKKLLVIALPIIVIIIVLSLYFGTSSSQNTFGTGVYGTKAGDFAPDIPITLTNGTTIYLSSLQPHPTLLWFVATWCNTCYEGVQVLGSQYYQTFRSKGLTIMVVELYKNLNQSAPAGSGIPNNITEFAQLGGGLGKPGWFYGTSDWGATHTYDPQAYLDIFYLINQYGVITMTGVGLPNYLSSIASQSFASAQLPPFPFQCLSQEQVQTHVHPYLRIIINGQNITIPAAIGIENPSFQTFNGYKVAVSGSCFEPIHTHDSSGIIHIESATDYPFTLGDFFLVWRATYGFVTINGSPHPIVFNPTDILGFKADAHHKIILLVDGKQSNAFDSLVLDQLDYCSANSSGPPCYPTAMGDPYYNGKLSPYGTGHTIVIEYVTT